MQPTADGDAVNPSPWLPVAIRLLDIFERATFDRRREPYVRFLGPILFALWIWLEAR